MVKKKPETMREWSDQSLLSRKRACFTAGRWFVLVNDPLIRNIFVFDVSDTQIRGCITLRQRRTIHFFRRLIPDARGFFPAMPKLLPLPAPSWCADVWREANALLVARRGGIHNIDI